MICENCGKEHDGSYGSGRFCSSKCAHIFVTKNDDKKELKEAKCIQCGKLIYINKRASIKTCKCKNCNNDYRIIKQCPICGRQHLIFEKCNNSFCNKHNIQQFKGLIKYFGFDKNKLGTLEVENEFNRIKNILYNLYWNEHLSSTEICKKFNYPNVGNITGKIFHYLEIPSKGVKKSVLENINFRNYIPQNNYKSFAYQIWHTTWNNKEVFLRSSYEEDYAKELDEQQIDYEVEYFHIKYFDTRKQEYRCAIPDFYIPSTNTIVEIKSEYTLDKLNMKDKKKAYLEQGYNFKLICDHKEIEI